MRNTLAVLALCSGALLAGANAQAPTPDPYAPLRLYDGTWQAVGGKVGAPPKKTTIVNQCQKVGTYYTCLQTVDGKEGSLVVFVPAQTPGDYFVQGVVPQGFATGRTRLKIDGRHWTYSQQVQEGGKPVTYRTTNQFADDDHIHYEMSQSSNGKNWTVTGHGDEAHEGGRNG